MRNETRGWLVSNALFAVALYVGMWLEEPLVGYPVAGFVWLMLVTYVAVLYSNSKQPRVRPVPFVVGCLFDLTVLAVLVTCGWSITATGYALSLGAHELIYWRPRPRPKGGS